MRSLFAALAAVVVAAQPAAAAGVCFKGVNLSGAEYGDRHGVENLNFTYPSEKTVAYFAGKGMNIVRLPFSWERLQPTLNSPLSVVEVDRLKAAVQRLRDHGMTVLLDPHAFGYYDKARLGTPEAPGFAFADLWIRLAAEFANEPDVLFGLMNEPYDIPATEWLAIANGAIAGIRSVGARNLVLVPGTRWSGAHGWRAEYPGGSNADVMRGVKDPIDNYAYEFHQYMDPDSSGTKGGCAAADAATAALVDVTAWLRETGRKGFLGEFGGSQDDACIAGLKAMTAVLDDNADAWLGFSYWAAGEWWPETEINNVQPTAKGDRKQLSGLPLTSGKQPDAAACVTMPPA
ncbi:glycoside hydrolase family 5 protein [Shinella sp. CPCC 101442]|nr:glycoside hydrolase family 5 protein [Shinella sp. CPCC 101442]MCR6500383.1 glycoside hydrolase family 5 protein [Shinella sp. CPCC 101442]